MIKAILIDDEKPSLRELQYFLKEYDEIEICGMFTDPEEALKKIYKLKPQIVFVDINMPEMSGLELAKAAIVNDQNVHIVFITAYEEYALQAFEMEALDYVMKPISKQRFEKTMKRILLRNTSEAAKVQNQEQKRKFIIRTFGKFEAMWENEAPLKWHSKKTKELFAFLVHNEGRVVSKDEILEAVFPDTEVEKGITNIHNCIYFIRKALRENGVDENLISIDGSYILRLMDVEVDSRIFRQKLKQISNGENLEELEAAEAIFKGDYLKGEDWIWSAEASGQLSALYRTVVVKLVRECMKKESFNKAEDLLLKLFIREPYDEEVTKLIILLYLQTKRKNQAILHYRKYEKVLKEELGTEVEKEIKWLLDYK
jgi:two-component system, LytTR family, response regulator